MKLRKTIVLIIGLALILTLAACGSSSSKKQTEDPNAIKAQKWAIAIDYGYPDEQEDEPQETHENEETEGDPAEVEEVDLGGNTEPNESVEPTDDNPAIDVEPVNNDNTSEPQSTTSNSKVDEVKSAVGSIAKIGAGVYVFGLIVCIIGILAMWKMFTIAGEAGWKSLIPIYNTYTYYQIVWGQGWRMFLTLIPIYGIIVMIKACLATARVYSNSSIVGVLLIVVPPIGKAIVAFNPKSEYIGPENY